jgi:hypothetical protein
MRLILQRKPCTAKAESVIIAANIGCAITDRLAIVHTRRVDAAARVRDKLRILDQTWA